MPICRIESANLAREAGRRSGVSLSGPAWSTTDVDGANAVRCRSVQRQPGWQSNLAVPICPVSPGPRKPDDANLVDSAGKIRPMPIWPTQIWATQTWPAQIGQCRSVQCRSVRRRWATQTWHAPDLKVNLPGTDRRKPDKPISGQTCPTVINANLCNGPGSKLAIRCRPCKIVFRCGSVRANIVRKPGRRKPERRRPLMQIAACKPGPHQSSTQCLVRQSRVHWKLAT